MKKLALTLSFFCLGLFTAPANWQMESRLLKCYTPDGSGNFSLHAISVKILGKVYDNGKTFPDLIVELDKWYPGARYYRYLRHDAKGVPVFEYADEVMLPYQTKDEGGNTTCAVQDGDNVRLFWYTIDTLHMATFDNLAMAFTDTKSVPFVKMRFKPKTMHVERLGKRGYRVWYGAQDRWAQPVPGNWRKGDYFPYDGAGIWRGKFSYMGLYCIDLDDMLEPVTAPEMVSAQSDEVLQSYCRISDIAFGGDNRGIVAGSYLGGLYYYRQKGKAIRMEEKRYLVNSLGNALRHPGVWAAPVSYPAADGKSCDVIATCEGGIYYYRHTGRFTPNGSPVYDDPTPLQENDPLLFGGSLVVPAVADWDGDGTLDLIAGNSQGIINFFRNTGTDAEPRFTTPVPLQAGGHTIHIQPGYREDIQGPLEARWGYVSPAVFDWNGDGRLDILTNDSRGKHMVFMGTEGPAENRLDPEHPLYVHDLDMHGTWRCRPGVARMGGHIVYITLDDDNQLHLYERIDDYNLRDKGKLTLRDGSNISAAAAASGGTGRLKIDITDWDGDGKMDLLLGTCKHHYVPNAQEGLPGSWHRTQKKQARDEQETYEPYSKKELKLYGPVYSDSGPEINPAATVLFMKNVGSNEKPVYQFPLQMRFKGEKIKLGQHAVGVTAAMLGKITDGLPNLIVGDERGRFYLLERTDLTW